MTVRQALNVVYAMVAEGRDEDQLAELDATLAEAPGDKALVKDLKIGA